MQILEIVVYIIVIAAVLWLSHYVTKKLSNNIGGFNSSKYIKHVDRMALSKDSFLSVVQIGDKYMVLGVSADRIDMLKEFEEDALKPIEKPVVASKNPLNSVKMYFEKGSSEKDESYAKNKKDIKNKSKKRKRQAIAEDSILQQTGDVTENNQHNEERIAFEEAMFNNNSRQLLSKNASQKNNEYNDEIFDEILKRTADRASKLKQKTEVDEGSRYV